MKWHAAAQIAVDHMDALVKKYSAICDSSPI